MLSCIYETGLISSAGAAGNGLAKSVVGASSLWENSPC